MRRICASALRSITATAWAVFSSRPRFRRILRPPEDRVERRAQFVRQRAEELVLEPVRFLGVAIQMDAIQRQTDAPRHVIEHQQAGAGETQFVLRQQRHHRLHPAFDGQGHHRGRPHGRRARGIGSAARSAWSRMFTRPCRDDAGEASRITARQASLCGVSLGGEPDRPIVAYGVNERRIGEKRHGELADDVEELLEADDRRQLVRRNSPGTPACRAARPARAGAIARPFPARRSRRAGVRWQLPSACVRSLTRCSNSACAASSICSLRRNVRSAAMRSVTSIACPST